MVVTADEVPASSATQRSPRSVWLVAALLPVLGLVLFSSTGRDDTYITYWAAHALSRLGEIVNYNGDRVEQSSSLLHTVVLAGLHLVTTLPVPLLGFLVGIVLGGVAAAVTGVAAHDARSGSAWLAAAVVATNPFVVYWSFGGLETSLAAVLTVAFVATSAVYTCRGGHRALGMAGVVIVAYVMVRPETGFIAVLALLALGVWALARKDLRRYVWRVAALAGTAIVAFGALVGWRLAYFGSAFPQPVAAKVGGVRPAEGLAYLQSTLGQPHAVLLLVLGIAGAVVALRRNIVVAVLAAAAAGAHLSFVLLSGGDWMEAGRLVAPALPLLALLAASLPLRRWSWAVGAALVVAQLIGVVSLAQVASTGKPLWAEVKPSAPTTAHWLEQHNRVHARHALFYEGLKDVVTAVSAEVDTPTIASGQAGMLVYRLSLDPHVPPVRFVDLFNLTTRALQECAPTSRTTPLGRFTAYGQWLDDPGCAAVRPHIVFDRKLFSEWRGLHDDYAVVHEQTGEMVVEGSALTGTEVSAEMFVAVRRDLVQHVGR